MTTTRWLVLMLTVAAVSAVPARPASQAPTPAVAPARGTPEAALQAWVEAFNSRDPKRIVARYAPTAVFWGTTATTIATTPEQVWAYFKDAGARPATRVSIDSRYQRAFGDSLAVISGGYTFADEVDGVRTNVRPARYTVVCQRIGGEWLFVEHHSSRLPQP